MVMNNSLGVHVARNDLTHHCTGRLDHYHDTLHMYRSHTRGPAMEDLVILMLFTQLIVILVVVVMVFLVCFLIRKNNHIEVS